MIPIVYFEIRFRKHGLIIRYFDYLCATLMISVRQALRKEG